MKRLCLALAVVAVVALAALPQIARADEIGIGGAAGTISFTSNGDGTLSFSTSGFTAGSPLATFQSPTGTPQDSGGATFGAMSGTTGVESLGIFPLTGVTESFTFTSGTDSDVLAGTITWVGIKDGTTSPQFDVNSTLSVTSVSGDSTFVNDFPKGSTAEVDFTIANPTSGLTLTDLAGKTAGTSESFSFSAGQVTPVPEPGTLALFGSGLIGVAGLIRRKLVRV